MLGISWQDRAYADVSVPFGLRHGASACQRTTEAVSILAKEECNADTHPYVDDTAGASVPETAQDHFEGLMQLMATLGLDAAPHKSAPPATVMLWIGVLF